VALGAAHDLPASVSAMRRSDKETTTKRVLKVFGAGHQHLRLSPMSVEALPAIAGRLSESPARLFDLATHKCYPDLPPLCPTLPDAYLSFRGPSEQFAVGTRLPPVPREKPEAPELRIKL
jgi:hypothetical protein